MSDRCVVDGCRKRAARGTMCKAHYAERKRRGSVAEVRELSPWEDVVEAWHAYEDAVSDDDFEHTKRRLRAAMDSYYRSRGWAKVSDVVATLKKRGVR